MIKKQKNKFQQGNKVKFVKDFTDVENGIFMKIGNKGTVEEVEKYYIRLSIGRNGNEELYVTDKSVLKTINND